MFKKIKKEEKIEETKPLVLLTEDKGDKNDNLKDLIEKNIKWTQIVYEQNKEIKARLTLMAVGSYIKILVILVPIILAFVYLPSILEQVFSQYSSLLGGKSISTDKILNNVSTTQMQELLKLINR